ncbi:hypothetical protein SAMN06265222_11786 [Neorhodopirellula lusitana]|uniref:Uncharacterized protein n=1 Tax=Neorhodopirellula lusitana TaxID=445327 RepID=A0ABY1QLB8_9BACT|nr:hypothetical protein SAMN06265222_11786 [Neorhodopirellula lusitana]
MDYESGFVDQASELWRVQLRGHAHWKLGDIVAIFGRAAGRLVPALQPRSFYIAIKIKLLGLGAMVFDRFGDRIQVHGFAEYFASTAGKQTIANVAGVHAGDDEHRDV